MSHTISEASTGCSETSSYTLAVLSEDSGSSSTSQGTYDHHTLGGAVSIPTVCSSSVSSADSPTCPLDTPSSHWNGETERNSASTASHRASFQACPNVQPELARIQELEQKRTALRNQRFSLEQRLYEFCGKHAEGGGRSPPVPPAGSRLVVDWDWKDPTTGLRVVYSGPLGKDGIPHGTAGTVKFADGQVYRGDVRHGLRDGHGSNTWADGQDYTGHWKENSRNGRGTHVWPDGRKVSGQWQDGHLHGKVYFSWPNGATYDGLVRKGKKHGRGVHTWSDGRVYNGSFAQGKENGFGTLSHPDGVKYRGQFKNGVKEGYGIMLWKTRTYDGEWIDNKPQGQGRVLWSNGANYTGQFYLGKYHGLGVYVWPSGKKFVGRWEEGTKHGHGLYTWPNGKKYDGEYKNGLKDGYGRMTWPDGRTYCGAFRQNKRCGRGVQAAPNGDIVHCGMWKGDTPIDENGTILPNLLAESDKPLVKVPQSVTVSVGPSASQFETDLESSKANDSRDICSPDMVARGDDEDDDDSCVMFATSVLDGELCAAGSVKPIELSPLAVQ